MHELWKGLSQTQKAGDRADAERRAQKSIHTLRGNIVHSVLEKFYELDANLFNKQTYKEDLSLFLKNLFNAYWSKNKSKLEKMDLGGKSLEFFYEESAMMLANWLTQFFIYYNR